MNQERHRRLVELFRACCDLQSGALAQYLDGLAEADRPLRVELEAMLASDAKGSGVLGKPPVAALSAARPLPQHIGSFRVLTLLGEGGMGSVYEAEQDYPQRRVALKVMRPGFASASLLRRFRLEVSALGRLQHPGIAQLFEAGTFDDGGGEQPYFAMELVRGHNLLEHVRHAPLNARARLELVARVCDAVHHAHVQGIVHRDLKPANVLVDSSGNPRILDFGVARALDVDVQTVSLATDVGQLVGTLPYMSPEQLEADPARIDARADVYALGVMTFELLAGRLPHDVRGKPIHEAARILREEEPTPLSSVDRVFRGDLDTIVAKALEKERERRYPSALALADDLRRYLRDEPILAHRPSRTYQLRKFARRNRALVFGAGAVFAALILGLIGTAWQAVRADARRLEAEREAGRVRSVLDFFLSGMLSSLNPWEQGRDVRMVTALDAAAAHASAAFGHDPELEGEVRSSLGRIYRNLGRMDQAEDQLKRARALYLAVGEPAAVAAHATASVLADVMAERGELAAALELLQATAAELARTLGPDDPETLTCAARTARVLRDLGRLSEAERTFEDVRARRARTLGSDHVDTLSAMAGLGHVYVSQQRFAEAEELAGVVHAGRLAQLGPDHPDTVRALQARARALMSLGRFAEAEQIDRGVVETLRRVLGDEHLDTLDALNELGGAVHESDGAAAAEPIYREAVERGRAVLGLEHPALATYCNNLGSALEEQRRWEDARELYLESLAIRERVYGSESLSVAKALNNLGTLAHRSGRADEAEGKYRRAIDLYRRLYGEAHADLATTLFNLGTLLLQGGRIEEAEFECASAARSAASTLEADHPTRTRIDAGHAACLLRLGRFAEAERILLERLAVFDHLDPPPAARLAELLQQLVPLYRAWGRPDLEACARERLGAR